MSGPQPPAFGELLRRHRVAAGMSQGGLARRAHVSVHSISALERGVYRAPNRETVVYLADALQLDEADCSVLEAASQGPRTSAPPDNLVRDEAESDTTLLTSKLTVPTGRSDLAIRPRLTDRLRDCRLFKLTVIAAPAGFGKTTLLAQWHSMEISGDMPVAWVSLDAADNDPVRFWRYTITAFEQISPSCATPALSRLQPP